MITGVHLLLFSREPEADRALLRDVLNFAYVDAGEGWLIFALPPTELGVHPAENDLTRVHAGQDISATIIYLMCQHLHETLEALAGKGVEHTEILEAGWGVTTTIQLPGGGKLGISRRGGA